MLYVPQSHMYQGLGVLSGAVGGDGAFKRLTSREVFRLLRCVLEEVWGILFPSPLHFAFSTFMRYCLYLATGLIEMGPISHSWTWLSK